MSHRTNHGPWIFLVLLSLGLLFGCTVPFGRARGGGPVAQPTGQIVPPPKTVTLVGGPRVDHALHAENDLECSDCHALDEATGEPRMPTLETCTDCHEDPEEGEEPEEGEPVMKGVYFDAEGKPLWKKAVADYDSEILFSHKAHAALKDCRTCHTDLSAENGRPAGEMFTMAECLDCHTRSQAPSACATCHARINRGTKPPSHARRWDERHGYASSRLRLTEVQHQCSLCHNEPSDCSDCHKVTPPRSHKHLWEKRHGQVVRAAGGDLPKKCSLCHDNRTFCESCHLDQAPRNHTTLFRTRTHGVMAAIDRSTCQTCHKTDFCVRCHEDTAPRSHRGMWSRRRNTHCVQCHFPVNSNNSCVICHRRNPTHPTAPDQPAGHVPGRDCRICHNAVGGGGAPRLRHLDNGQSCEFCHR